MRCTIGLLISLIAICCGQAVGRDADESRLMPRKDQQISALLVKIKADKESKEAQAELRKMERERLCRGLAYGLMRYETRYGALRFINAEGPFKELTPYVVLALKWGSSQERLVALDIVLKTRAKAAIPVLLSHVLDDDYLQYETVGEERGPRGHFRPGRSVASVGLFAKTSRTLRLLSGGKIGSPSLAARARSTKCEPMKRKWRAWWQQNAGKHFPHLKTEEVVFQNEQQVRKWCEEITRTWGAALTAEAEREFAEFCKKVPRRVAHGKTRRHANTDDPDDDATPNYLVIFVDKVGGVKQPVDKVYHADISIGDNDAEWVVFNTCRFLNKGDAQLKTMMSGAHLLLGYVTRMLIYRDAGMEFSAELRTETIKQAWFDQADEYQVTGKIARVFGATSAENNRAVNLIEETGKYPIVMSRDPGDSSTYTHWDFTVP